MTSSPSGPDFSAGQRQACDELEAIAERASGRLSVGEPYAGSREYMVADITLDVPGLSTEPYGILFEPRETIKILIPADFPFDMPAAEVTHKRWAGMPHVQFGRHLCLYASPTLEWNPSDGMYGYLQRLVTWLERAAAGRLTEVGQPMHPPIAYPGCDDVVVVHANAPRASGTHPWLGAALLKRVSPGRVDVVGWLTEEQTLPKSGAGARNAARNAGASISRETRVFYGPTIVLNEEIYFEYPLNTGDLVDALDARSVPKNSLLGLLGAAAYGNAKLDDGPADLTADPHEEDYSSYVLIGTPSLGIAGERERITSLVAWRIPGAINVLLAARAAAHLGSESFRTIGAALQELAVEYLSTAPIEWAAVLEARPELVTRRDASAAAHWLSRRRVLVLGAGALGAPVVEAAARGGAAEVTVVDYSIVHPGILVRQPYADADVGLPKATVLAERLGQLGLTCVIRPVDRDAVEVTREMDSGARAYDLIIDTTANRTVRAELERHRSIARDTWPATVALMIGHTAQRGIASISLPLATGGPADILRRLSLFARANNETDVVDDFFADPPRADLFHPEPGCSDATFIGGLPDTVGLAGQLLTGALDLLSRGEDSVPWSGVDRIAFNSAFSATGVIMPRGVRVC